MGQTKRENRVHNIFDPQIRKKHHREKDGSIGHTYIIWKNILYINIQKILNIIYYVFIFCEKIYYLHKTFRMVQFPIWIYNFGFGFEAKAAAWTGHALHVDNTENLKRKLFLKNSKIYFVKNILYPT